MPLCRLSLLKIKRFFSAFMVLMLLFPSWQPVLGAGFDFFGLGGSTANETVEKPLTPQIIQEDLVALLVEEALLNDRTLNSHINTYADDVQKTLGAQAVIVPIPENSNVLDIYEGLSHFYFLGHKSNALAQLKGVVLIGDIPLPVVDKGGRFWPTIFPYTDFENPSYRWDHDSGRFVYQGQGRLVPEIWHGVIDSDKTGYDYRIDDLKNYFIENHKVHTGQKEYSRQIFYADLPTQRKRMVPELIEKYEAWIENLESIQYYRFSSERLMSLYDGLMGSSDIMADQADAGVRSAMGQVPDIQAGQIGRNFMQRYIETGKNWLSQVNGLVVSAGRWTNTEIDTTISLVGKKDEISALLLKEANDQIEQTLLAAIEEYNVATKIAVPKIQYENNPADPYNRIEEKIKRPLYWNGVERSVLSATDCSLFRGSTLGNKVEANRTYNQTTVGTCETPESEVEDIIADKYEGCCANNLDFENSDGSFSYDTCDTGSLWSGGVHQGAELPVFDITGTKALEGPDGASGCGVIFEKSNEDESYASRFDSLVTHHEPTPETLAAQSKALGTLALPVDDPRGFSFYGHDRGFRRIDYPNLFDYRNSVDTQSDFVNRLANDLETLIVSLNEITELGNQSTDLRYETDREFEWPGVKFQTPSAPAGQSVEGGCTYGKSFSTPDEFTRRITWNEDCQFQFFSLSTTTDSNGNTNTTRTDHDSFGTQNIMSRFYEKGKPIPTNILGAGLGDLSPAKIYEALSWIDKPIEDKNLEVFSLAMNEASVYQDFFYKDDFEGYELAQIQSEGDPEGIEVSFLGNRRSLDTQLVEAQGTEGLFAYEDRIKQEAAFGQPELDKDCEKDNWVSQIACQWAGLGKAKTRKVRFDNGQKIIAQTPKLSGKRLVSNVDSIIVSNTDVNPIKVELSLIDRAGNVDTSNFESRVRLDFNTANVTRFFRVSPAQEIPLTAGKATFYLIPKTSKFGGEMTVSANVVGAPETLQTSLSVSDIPLKVVRYSLGASLNKTRVQAGSQAVQLSVGAFDTDREVTSKLDGAVVEFSSEQGGFVGGVNQVQLQNGRSIIEYIPPIKSGKYAITVQDDKQRLASDQVEIRVEPGEAETLRFIEAPEYLLWQDDFVPITVALVDKYQNALDLIDQELTWNTVGLEVQNRADIDTDPRQNGIQQWIHSGGSTLWVRPISGKKKQSISVTSSAVDKGTQKTFTVLDRGQLGYEINKETVIAGSREPIQVLFEAIYDKGEGYLPNIPVQVAVTPAEFPDVPAIVNLVKGRGKLTIEPGTKAGKYSIILSHPALETSTIDFEVLPATPAKIELSSTQQTWDNTARNFDVEVVVRDKYRNRAIAFNDRISLGVTDDSSGLALLSAQELELRQGKATLTPKPTGKTGTLNLIAQAEGLVGDTLSLKLLSLQDQSDVAWMPETLTTLMLGFSAGDLRYKNSPARRTLSEGLTQSIITQTSASEVPKSLGWISQSHQISPELDPHFLFHREPYVLLENEGHIFARARFLYDKNPKLFFDKSLKKQGVYFFSEESLDLEIEKIGDTIYLDRRPLFSMNEKGGIQPRGGGLTFAFKNQDLTLWSVYSGETLVGDLRFYIPQNIVAGDSYKTSDFQGVFLEMVDNSIGTQPAFIGTDTHGDRGFSFVDYTKKETQLRQLTSVGAPAPNLGWKGPWKPAALFAAGNTVGDSTLPGATDDLIVYGDPTLSVDSVNNVVTQGHTADLGKLVWRFPTGNIRDTLTADINDDELIDILTLVNNDLFVMYGEGEQDFTSPQSLLSFKKGVKEITVLASNPQDSTGGTDFDSLVQVDGEGKVFLHTNKEGRFISSLLFNGRVFDGLKAGSFNDDTYTDLALMDRDQTLYIAFGSLDGFGSPQRLYDFAPTFETIDERSDSNTIGYLDQLEIYFDGIETTPGFRENATSKFNKDRRSVVVSSENLEAIWEQKIKPNTANQTGFLPLDKAPLLSRVRVSASDVSVTRGDRIKTQLSFRATGSLNNIQLKIPSSNQLRILTDTIKCEGCTGRISSNDQGLLLRGFSLPAGGLAQISFEREVQSLSSVQFYVGDFEQGADNIDDIRVPWGIGGERKLIQFLSASNLGYQLKHGLASVDGGTTIETESTKDGDIPENFSNPVVTDADNTEERKSAAVEVAESQKLLEMVQSDPLAFAEEFFARDSDGDQIPDQIDLYPIPFPDQEVLELEQVVESALSISEQFMIEFLCGGGQCNLIPISIAALAPGNWTLHLNPYSLVTEYKDMGLPVFGYPTTLYIPYPIPYFYPGSNIWESSSDYPSQPGRSTVAPQYNLPGGGVYSSIFRLYVSPTTTQKVAVAFCFSSYVNSFEDPEEEIDDNEEIEVDLFAAFDGGIEFPDLSDAGTPNCFVLTFDPGEELDFCDEEPAYEEAELLALAAGASGSAIVTTESPADIFSFQVDGDVPPNIQIPSSDAFSTWLQQQAKSFNAQLANVFSQVQAVWPDWSREKNKPKQQPLDENPSLIERLSHELSQYPFINVREETIEIPLPNMGKEEWNALRERSIKWKDDNKKVLEQKAADTAVFIEKKAKTLPAEIASSWKAAALADLERAVGAIEVEMDRVFTQLEANVEILEVYADLPTQLDELTTQTVEFMLEVKDAATDIQAFYDGWWGENLARLDEWTAMKDTVVEMLEAWEEIPKTFLEFTDTYWTCVVDRGTQSNWYFRLFVSYKFPTIQIDMNPDVTLDLSDVKVGLEVIIPELDVRRVDVLKAINLPDPNEIIGLEFAGSLENPRVLDGFGVDFGPIPAIPEGLLDVELAIDLEIPELPMVPAPPEVPNVLETLMDIVEIPFALFDLFGLRRIGIMLTPEYNLKAYIEQLTNREDLFTSLDFNFTLEGDSIVFDPNLEINAKADLKLTNEGLIDSLLDSQDILSDFVSEVNTLQRSGESGGNISSSAGSEIQANNDVGNNRTKTYSDARSLVEAIHAQAIAIDVKQPWQHRIKQRMLAIKVPVKNHHVRERSSAIAAWKQTEQNLEALAAEWTEMRAVAKYNDTGRIDENLLASFQSNPLPQGERQIVLHENFESTQVFQQSTTAPTKPFGNLDQAPVGQPVPQGLYLLDPNGLGGKRLMSGDTVYGMDVEMRDLDDDGQDDLILTQNGNLYVKWAYEQPKQVESSSRNKASMTYEKFQSFTETTQSFAQYQQSTGSSLNFKPFDDGIDYYEWFLSDRPDAVFEMSAHPSERASTIWERQALISDKVLDRYEIAAIAGNATRIIGKPIVRQPALEKLEPQGRSTCESGTVNLPQLSGSTLLLAPNGEAKFEVRVPSNIYRPAEYQLLVLREGEQTRIEDGRVCLYSGNLWALRSDAPLVATPLTTDTPIVPGSSIILAEEDRVDLSFGNGIKTVVYGGETYHLHGYNQNRDRIALKTKDHSDLNRYGFLIGLQSSGPSVLHSVSTHPARP